MNDEMQLKEGLYAPYFKQYMSYTYGKDIQELLLTQIDELKENFATKNDAWSTTPYQVSKWTPKEMLGHIIDTDRIFSYRALCLARSESALLPGFDENSYVASANFNALTVKDLIEDFEISRKSLHSMVRNFSEEVLSNTGNVNGSKMKCGDLISIIPGHFIHHMNILKDRY